MSNPSSDHQNLFEFDEADVWNNSNDPAATTNNSDAKKPLPSSRVSPKKLVRKLESSSDHKHRTPQEPASSASLPVNIPDWSKILKSEYREHRKTSDEEGVTNDAEGYDGSVPPHEYLARRRGASFSVLEGIGRTLKGRDLRRVRNAVWKKIGFED
ncbi:hypothetical protein PTKIN_Ptkin13bG0267200 [Pterospermum kingtungense]